MKIAELRELSEKASQKDLETALAEVYKKLPKEKKLECDEMITMILQGKGKPAAKKKAPAVLTDADFEKKIEDIDEFIQNARDNLYWYSNRTVSKKKQANWRNEVKGYLTFLEGIDAGSPHHGDALDSLWDLYELLCRGCIWKLFHTEDVFEALNIGQDDLYETIARREWDFELIPEAYYRLVEESCSDGVGREFIAKDIQARLLKLLENDEQRQACLEQAKLYRDDQKKLADNAVDSWIYDPDTSKFTFQKRGEHASDLILQLYINLNRQKEGMDDFMKNDPQPDGEIRLFRMFDQVPRQTDGQKKMLIDSYDQAIRDGIDPRDSLQKIYKELKGQIS